jgi:sulfatase maturation enzyme AslB (radical SAM superfamily)
MYDDKVYNPRFYEKCMDCSIRTYCNGGCNYNLINNNYEPLESICKIYKILYLEVLNIFDSLKTNSNFLNIINEGLKNCG